MDTFDAQTLVQSGSDGKTVVMSFEDANGNHFTLSVPSQVALAMIPVLEGMKTTKNAVGAFATKAQEWRTARDQDSPNVFIEVRGHAPLVFDLNGAKALSQQVREHCEEIERRGATKLQ